jgi:hypothetical protein
MTVRNGTGTTVKKNKHDCSEWYRHYNKKTNMTARNGTGTTIKSDRITLVVWTQASALGEIMRSCYCECNGDPLL